MSEYITFAEDFNFYWCAARIALVHGDPYAADAIGQCFRSENLDQHIYQFNYIPVSFPFMFPFALFDRPLAKVLWVGCLIVAVVAAVSMILRRMNLKGELPKVPWVTSAAMVICFPFFLSELFLGQMNWIPLLGLALFSSMAGSGKYFSAGLAITLLAAKPHLFSVAFGFMLTAGNFADRLRVWSGGLLGIGSLGLILLLFSPDLISHFLKHLHEITGNSEMFFWGVTISQQLSSFDIARGSSLVFPLIGLVFGALMGRGQRLQSAALTMPLSVLLAPHAFSTACLLIFESWIWCWGRLYNLSKALSVTLFMLIAYFSIPDPMNVTHVTLGILLLLTLTIAWFRSVERRSRLTTLLDVRSGPYPAPPV